MGRWLYRFPINVTLPVLLFLAGLGLSGLYTVTLIQDQQRSILENSERELTTEISRMQRLVQHHLGNADSSLVQEEIAALYPDIRVRQARVVNDQNRILAALDQSQRGRVLGDPHATTEAAAVDAVALGLLADARSRRAAAVHYVASAKTLVAVAPLEITGTAIELGPSPAGAVMVAWDLSYPFRQAREAALGSAALLSPVMVAAFIGLWWLLYIVLGRRLTRLTRTAEMIAAGDTSQRSAVAGDDEIGRLGESFRAMTDSLVREKEYAQVTLASIGDGVVTTDTAGHVTFLNPVAEHLTGWSNAEARGRPVTEVFHIVHGVTRRPAMNPVERCLCEGHIVGLASHTLLLRSDGQEFAIEDSAAPIRDHDGAMVGVVLVFHDVTEARELADQLNWQATHDALTGLHNRYAFEQQLEHLARHPESMRGHERHTLLYIDLDQFKVINDVAGHVAGDQMLRQLAGLMRERVRDTDMLARLGGDEFGVILPHCDIEHAQRVAEGLHRALEEYRFVWESRTFRISASIGILEFNPGKQGFTDLLSDADIAVYAAKKAGRRRSHLFRPDDQALLQERQEMDWATQISDAVDAGRLELFAQAIVPLARVPSAVDEGLSFEVLVRMRGPEGDLIPPGAFLPAAERFDLIAMVDRWIITRTFSLIAEHIDRHGEQSIAHCAVNLSGSTLSDESLLPFIKEQLTHHALPAETVCFEVTETTAISNFQSAMRFIRDLRAMGCRFALDDFGSGLSSFAYLRTLPVDYLKIDGSFVRDIARDPVNQALVSNINDVGHLLGKQTIAEFAEDEATIACLRELGVDYAQGYGLHRPEPLEQLLAAGVVPRPRE